MKIRCLIVDDEPPAVRLISAYVGRVPELELVATCNSAIEAFSLLRLQHIDLIFLDIKMPQLLGTDFIRSLPDPPKIILITAYREYALDGYELDIVDYLLKPVSFPRFMKAFAKATKLFSPEMKAVPVAGQPNEEEKSFLYFRVNKEMVKVLLHEILFIESSKEYVKLYMDDNRMLLVKQGITSLEKLLSPHRFIRVHRSYIVTAQKIRAYSAGLIMIGGHEIPIGRLYKNGVDEILNR